MLHDPKSIALVDNFAGQWLQLRNLDSVKPDPDKFPEFDAELRASMQHETRLFFKNMMDEDRSILDFLNAKYSFLNERLAKFYGIDGVTGNEFRKVDLTGTPARRPAHTGQRADGFLYPNRTSVVIRGKWVLENLLNAPPPPPPPDVPSLDEKGLGVTVSLRQQMEMHRANPVCASCHTKMDPLGFGLENFNAIGKYRTIDGKFPIDASGTLPDGTAFQVGRRTRESACCAAAVLCGMRHRKNADLRTWAEAWKPTINLPCTRSSPKPGRRDYRFSNSGLGNSQQLPFQMRAADDGGKNDHHT